MNEKEWVTMVVGLLRSRLATPTPVLTVAQGIKLPYAHEIKSYSGTGAVELNTAEYETDILISERLSAGDWTPRVVIEAKLSRVTTHAVITYSDKAAAHKRVHPYLRYGIFLGNRKHYPLPGRLYRHGAYFDFMLSWKAYDPDNDELAKLVNVIRQEVNASKLLEDILYTSRQPGRKRYTVLHRKLELD